MTKINEIYKCNKCGNITSVACNGVGGLYCCGEKMTLQNLITILDIEAKHRPVVEKVNDTYYIIMIGRDNLHPMTKLHHIEFVEVYLANNTKIIKRFEDNENAEFVLETKVAIKKVVAFCNLHGLSETILKD